MTILQIQHTSKNYYITLSIENNTYIIKVYSLLSGYPEKTNVYNINDKKKAYNTYKTYTKKYI